MTDLSRSLLNAAREGLSPDAAIAARVRAKVAASVAAGAATTATTVASSATTATATTGSTSAIAATTSAKAGSTSLLLKLGAVLLVLGAATVTITATRDHTTDAPRLAMSTANDVDEPRTADRSVAHDSSREAVHRTTQPLPAAVTTDDHHAAAIDPSEIEHNPVLRIGDLRCLDRGGSIVPAMTVEENPQPEVAGADRPDPHSRRIDDDAHGRATTVAARRPG